MRRHNIYFLTVIWQGSFGIRSISLSVFNHSQVFPLCWVWLRDFSKKIGNQILLGVSAFCWATWLSRNDVVFQRTAPNSYLQISFRGTNWAKCWLQLSKGVKKVSLKRRSCILENTIMEFYSKCGWNFQKQYWCLKCFSSLDPF